MLRYLIPVVVIVLLLDALVRLVMYWTTAQEHLALYSATVCLATAAVLTLVIGMVTRIIGGWLEQAEHARDKAIAEYRIAVIGLKLCQGQPGPEKRRTEPDQWRSQKHLTGPEGVSSGVHELKKPVRVLTLNIDLLRKRGQHRHGQSDDLNTLASMDTTTKYMERIVNNILEYAKTESGNYEVTLDWFCLTTLLQDVSNIMAPLLAPGGNSLVIEQPTAIGQVHADQQLVEQCLVNLLGNANEATHNGKLTLSVQREHDRDGDWLALRVTDTGCGMTLEQQQRLFQPFVRVVEDGQKNRKGSRLGLVISRNYCKLMKGELTLEKSSPGAGSTFIMRLPLLAPPVVQPPPDLAMTTTDGGTGPVSAQADSPGPDAAGHRRLCVHDGGAEPS